jgi:hypothetical protein
MRVWHTADQPAGQTVEYRLVITASKWQERFADDCHCFLLSSNLQRKTAAPGWIGNFRAGENLH